LPEKQILGDIPVRVYRTNANDGAELAVTHIPRQGKGGSALPVILLHGNYTARNFCISPKVIGMGACLSKEGFDVWIPELRGHGMSPKGDNFQAITAEDQIRYDVPAIHRCVTDETGAASLHWIGHSIGGVFILAALSAGWLPKDEVCSLVSFGSQISKGEGYLKIPPLAWLLSFLLKRIGHLPAQRLGLGPEIESAGTMIEMINWKKFRGRWRSLEGIDYWAGFQRIDIPYLAFAGAADRNDPPEGCRLMVDKLGSSDKMLTVLGKRQGFMKDYDHVGMVVSREAVDEVWPLVSAWLKKYPV